MRHLSSTRGRAGRFLAALAALAAAAGCSSGEVAPPAGPRDGAAAAPVSADDAAAGRRFVLAPPDAGVQPWESVAPGAYETCVGTGFDPDRFAAQWGGFGADGRYRPALEELAGGPLGRPLTTAERAALEARLDEHEAAIRAAARRAYDCLRVALDAEWQADRVLRAEVGDPAGERARQAAFEAARAAGGFTYTDVFTSGGWEIQVLVSSPEHPEFHFAFKELRGAVAARSEDAGQYLAALPRA